MFIFGVKSGDLYGRQSTIARGADWNSEAAGNEQQRNK